MSEAGRLLRVRRYPVKSFRGEDLDTAIVETHGLQGDRVFAFAEPGNPSNFPWVSARRIPEMILFTPRIKDVASLDVEVRDPEGRIHSMNDPSYRLELEKRWQRPLELRRSQDGHPDAQPLSFLTMQSVRALAEEGGLDSELDPVRFRPNLIVDWSGSSAPYPEDDLVGRELSVGDEVVIKIEKRDKRCVIVNLEPATAQANPQVLMAVGKVRKGYLGVYASVVRSGSARVGDPIKILR
jgi:uncharacterized protein YcbX